MRRSGSLLKRPSWPWGHWFFQGVVAVLLLNGSLHAASTLIPEAESFPGVMIFQEEKLTVRVTGASLRQVLAEFEKRSGAQVRWLADGGDEQISVAFFSLPLSEALQRLLGTRSFLLFYRSTKDGLQLSHLWIAAHAPDVTQAGAHELPFPDASVATPLHSDFTRHAEESPDTLIWMALHESNPAARIDALTRLGGYAQDDPRVQTVLSEVVRSDHDPQVQAAAAEMLQNME